MYELFFQIIFDELSTFDMALKMEFAFGERTLKVKVGEILGHDSIRDVACSRSTSELLSFRSQVACQQGGGDGCSHGIYNAPSILLGKRYNTIYMNDGN